MIINNINISTFDMKLLTVDIQNREITNNSTWTANAINPNFIKNTNGFKNIKLELLCKGINRQTILNNISSLFCEFNKNKSNTVLLDNYDNNFICSLVNAQTNKKSKTRYTLELELIGYEESTKETFIKISDTDNHTITNNGTSITPCYLEIMPTFSYSSLTITGLSDDHIKINNITANKMIIIDGYTNKITENGINKFNDVELFEFPRLNVGNNIVKISDDRATLTVKWKERFI